jgi:hypothetical protein
VFGHKQEIDNGLVYTTSICFKEKKESHIVSSIIRLDLRYYQELVNQILLFFFPKRKSIHNVHIEHEKAFETKEHRWWAATWTMWATKLAGAWIGYNQSWVVIKKGICLNDSSSDGHYGS